MLDADELSDRSFRRFHQFSYRISASVRFQNSKTEVQIAVFSSIFNGLVKETDIEFGRFEDDQMNRLHFSGALRAEIAAHTRFEPIEAGFAYINRAEVFHKVIERHPKDAFVVVSVSMLHLIVVVVVVLAAACLCLR